MGQPRGVQGIREKLRTECWNQSSGNGSAALPSVPCPSVLSVVAFLPPQKMCNVRANYQVSWVSSLAVLRKGKQRQHLRKMARFQT